MADRGGRLQRRRLLDLAVADEPLEQRTTQSPCSWAMATAPSSPQVTYAGRGRTRTADRGRRFHRQRPARPGRLPTIAGGASRCCWATATGRSSPQVELRGRVRVRCDRGRRLQRRRQARPGRRSTRRSEYASRSLAGQRRRDVPARGHLPGRDRARCHRRGRLHRQRPASTWPSPTMAPTRSRSCWATATGRSSPQVDLPGRVRALTPSWRATSTATASSTWPSRTFTRTTSRSCWATATARSRRRPVRHHPAMPTPLVADVNGDGTDDVLVVDGAGDILYRQGIPGQPGSFLPPVTVNPGVPLARHRLGARYPDRARCWPASTPSDDAVSLYAWRDGGFVRDRLARHRAAAGADHRGRPQRHRLRRPGRPQRRRRHALGLLRTADRQTR